MRIPKKVVLGLSEEYTLVCVIDVKTGRDTVTRMNDRRSALVEGWDTVRTFDNRMARIADTFAAEEDRQRLKDETKLARVEEELEDRESYTVPYRVTMNGRRERWMVRFMREGANGRRIVAAFRNMDDFTDALPVISTLSESMPGGFLICHADGERKLIFFNDLMVTLLGCAGREEFIVHTGNSFPGVIHPQDAAETARSVTVQIRENETGMFHVIFRARRRDDGVCWLECFGRMARGDVTGDVFYVFLVDITDNYTRRRNAITAEVREEERKKLRRELNAGNQGALSARLFEGRRVLLADDSEMTLELNHDILEDQGAEVTCVRNGREALDLVIAGRRFDFILMDLVMPVMNGVDATREITRLARATDRVLPVVALTSDGSDGQVRDVLKAGACECLYKPLNISELSRVLIAQMREASDRLAEHTARVSEHSRVDPLTGVRNIMAYTDHVATLSAEMAQDEHFTLGVMLCDCDGLEEVNRLRGHDIGDLFIRNCCKLICDIFVHSPVYRIGGDEFAVILNGPDLRNISSLLDEFLRAREETAALPDEWHGRASVSIGCAVCDRERDGTVSDIMHRADEAMRRDKKRTRTE